jgi:hypothetical protein
MLATGRAQQWFEFIAKTLTATSPRTPASRSLKRI